MTKDEFIAVATAAAQTSSATSGFPLGVTVAQAALESAWGNSRLAREAKNYFGIKAHAGGEAIELLTVEYVDGTPVRSTAKFAKYASMTECFAARDRMIASLPAYAEARAAAGDAEAFVCALARHWATDPGYAEKVQYVYRAHGLDKLDSCWMPAASTK
jgi:flagellar protein FlgJ